MVLLLWASECWNTLSVLSVCKVWSVSLDCASFFGNTLMRKLMHSNHMFGFNRTWWRHQMETFSALLAFCAGNSPVSGEFPAQRPVTRSFDVFFDLHLIKLMSKHSRGWWFETLSRPLWRHCNEQGGISVMEWSQQQPCHQWSHPHCHVWNVTHYQYHVDLGILFKQFTMSIPKYCILSTFYWTSTKFLLSSGSETESTRMYTGTDFEHCMSACLPLSSTNITSNLLQCSFSHKPLCS